MDPHIEFEEEEIIVTRPGTDFMVAYRKPSDRQNVDVGPMPAPKYCRQCRVFQWWRSLVAARRSRQQSVRQQYL